ncbi:MAG: hypothetical protein AB7O43_11975 [Hyphomicrobiaceae bacterium]
MRGTAGLAGTALTLAVAAFGSPVLAGDFGCRGECYERVRLPDTYARVDRVVVVAPGRTEYVNHPPIVLNRTRRVDLIPGQWVPRYEPALYGARARIVLIRPARTVYRRTPAVTRTVARRIIVKPAVVRWERRVGSFGRERMCKIVVPAVTRTVTRKVVVPGRRIAQTIPARYGTVYQPILVREARVRHTFIPPVQAFRPEPIIVRPAVTEVFTRPPVYGIESRRVLVRHGGTAWVRSRWPY